MGLYFSSLDSTYYGPGSVHIVVVLQSYFDFSGEPTQAKDFVVTLGGIASTKSRWEAFDKAWTKAMTRGGAAGKTLHMREFVHSRGEWTNWSDARKIALLEILHPVVSAFSEYMIAPSVPLEAYRRIIKTTVSQARDEWQEREFLLQVCMEAMVKRLRLSSRRQAIMNFEKDDVVDPGIHRYFNHVVAMNHWENIFVDMRFPRRGPSPLQAADLIAYSNYQQARRELTGHVRGELRRFLCEMVERMAKTSRFRRNVKCDFGLYDEQMLRNHVRSVAATLPTLTPQRIREIDQHWTSADLRMQRERSAKALRGKGKMK